MPEDRVGHPSSTRPGDAPHPEEGRVWFRSRSGIGDPRREFIPLSRGRPNGSIAMVLNRSALHDLPGIACGRQRGSPRYAVGDESSWGSSSLNLIGQRRGCKGNPGSRSTIRVSAIKTRKRGGRVSSRGHSGSPPTRFPATRPAPRAAATRVPAADISPTPGILAIPGSIPPVTPDPSQNSSATLVFASSCARLQYG